MNMIEEMTAWMSVALVATVANAVIFLRWLRKERSKTK